MSLLEDIKYNFKTRNTLIQLIYLNLGVFLFIKVLQAILFLMNQIQVFDTVLHWLALPANIKSLLFKPWTLITYMFLHEGFLHILFNMIWLYFGGRIFQQYLTNRQMLSTYILGGLAGGILYILAFNIFPAFRNVLDISIALGASASVLAIVIAVATYVPNYSVHLIFIGPVRLKYIAMVAVLLDIISLPAGNAGGHIAHLGGALFGFLYIQQLKKGTDISLNFHQWLNSLQVFFKSLFTSSNKPKMKVKHSKPMSDAEYNRQQKVKQDEIDSILDKISKSGYDSLTKKEKEILFKASNDNN